MARAKLKTIAGSLMVVAGGVCCALFLLGATVGTSERWSYEVVHEGVNRVSGLAAHGGILYVTQEELDGNGTLLAIHDGEREVLWNGLAKPDGLVRFGERLILTQEGGARDVIEWHDGIAEHLFATVNAEGVDVGPRGNVYVVEDRAEGRLLRFDRVTGEVETMVDGLEEAEGICVMDDGTVYYTEKEEGAVYRWRDGESVRYLADLHKPGFLQCDDPKAGIWITEDRTNLGRLLHANAAGQIQVVGERLRSPQSIVKRDNGDLLVAEQGRNRVLRFTRWRGQEPLTAAGH